MSSGSLSMIWIWAPLSDVLQSANPHGKMLFSKKELLLCNSALLLLPELLLLLLVEAPASQKRDPLRVKEGIEGLSEGKGMEGL